jgi:hypothetical protein
VGKGPGGNPAFSTRVGSTECHRPKLRRGGFRLGLFPMTAFTDAVSIARCCRWTAAIAALVHQPAARFAILSHRLRGLPLMSRPPSGEPTGGSRKGSTRFSNRLRPTTSMRPRVIHALLCPKPSRMQSSRLKNYAAAWKVVSYGFTRGEPSPLSQCPRTTRVAVEDGWLPPRTRRVRERVPGLLRRPGHLLCRHHEGGRGGANLPHSRWPSRR